MKRKKCFFMILLGMLVLLMGCGSGENEEKDSKKEPDTVQTVAEPGESIPSELPSEPETNNGVPVWSGDVIVD